MVAVMLDGNKNISRARKRVSAVLDSSSLC